MSFSKRSACRWKPASCRGKAKDPEAVVTCMGHVDTSMGAVYRERISDERLRAVVNVVGAWLWEGGQDDE